MFVEKWDAPMSADAQRPPVLGGHVFTKFDACRAVLFGGRTEGKRTDDTWIFDLEAKVSKSYIFPTDKVPTTYRHLMVHLT